MQRNFVAFIVVSLLVFFGWIYLQTVLWPPVPVPKKPEDGKGPITKKITPQIPAEFPPYLKRRLGELHPNLTEVLPLFPPEQLAAVGAWHKIQLFQPPAPKKDPGKEPRTVTLGGKDHYLEATLTTRGAGVQRLRLTRFEAANYLGKPENQKLDLIPEDWEMPSFLMYHYPRTRLEKGLPKTISPDEDGKLGPVFTLGEQVWDLESDPANTEEARFSTTLNEFPDLKITKIYRLEKETYHLSLSIEITNTQEQGTKADPIPFRYQLAGAHGLPIEGSWYTSVYRQTLIGTVDKSNNLWRLQEEVNSITNRQGGDRVPSSDLGESAIQYAAVTNQYFASAIVVDNEQPPAEDGGTDRRRILAWARATLETEEAKGRLLAVGENSLLFETAKGVEPYVLLPRVKDHIKDARIKTKSNCVISFYQKSDGTRVATWIRPGEVPKAFFNDITVRAQSLPIDLHPGTRVVHRFLLYNGPIKVKLLGQLSGNNQVPDQWVDRYAYTLHLRTLTDYGRFGIWSDLIIACTNLMHIILGLLDKLVGWIPFIGYGLSIILLTVIVRMALFPISRKQAYFSIKMQEIAPEVKKIQEKYKNDPKARTEATMELYRRYGVNPIGGCLPIVMQMPIFIGLYFALQESIYFRLAEFLWIQNLAAPDMLLFWSEGIPWVSDPDNLGGFFYLGPYLNVLPIIAVSLMVVQQKVMTPPAQDEQQETQFRMMRYMMIFFGILFYKVAAGLCLYFIASTLWGLSERRFLPKKPGPIAASPVSGPPSKQGSRGKDKTPPKKDDGRFSKIKTWWQDVLDQAKKK